MKHSEIRARLSEYLERDLAPEERSRIEAHLASCASCASELHEIRATVSLLRRLPEPGYPHGLADAVMARVAQDARPPARVRSPVSWVSEPRFAAALAAGIAGAFLLFQPDDRDPSTGAPAADSPGTVASTREPSPPRTAVAEMRQSGGRAAGAAVLSGATPSGMYAAYTRRAKLEEMARQLRGAGHPFSESVAAHFEAQPTAVLADWQPR